MSCLIEESGDVLSEVIVDELLRAWVLETLDTYDLIVVDNVRLSSVFFIKQLDFSSFL